MSPNPAANRRGSKRRIRTLLISRSWLHRGGVVNYVRLLLKHMSADEVCFQHVAIGQRSPVSPAWHRPFEYAASAWRFFGAIRRTKPDVIHLNPSLNWHSLPLNLLLLLIAAAVSRSPILVFLRGWREKVAHSMIESNPSGIFLRAVLRRADYYLVLTEGFRRQLIAAGLPAERIFVSPVMVEADRFAADGQAALADGEFRVLFLSHLSRNKGIWHLAESIKWLQANHNRAPMTFVLAGSGPEAGALRSFLEAEIEAGIVSMPGYVRGLEKVRLYREADLFVFPSYHEGFPNVIVEALAAGLPLIYTPVGALQDVLGPENGVRLDLSRLGAETLGQEIWNLYQDPARRQAMALANRSLAMECYNVSVVCAQMAALYRQIAGATS